MKSGAQITQERKAWARARLLTAWLKVSKAIEDPDLTAEQLDINDGELHEAIGICTEWGVDPRTVIHDEIEAAGAER